MGGDFTHSTKDAMRALTCGKTIVCESTEFTPEKVQRLGFKIYLEILFNIKWKVIEPEEYEVDLKFYD